MASLDSGSNIDTRYVVISEIDAFLLSSNLGDYGKACIIFLTS